MCVCVCVYIYIYIYIYIGIWYTVNVCIGRVVFCCGCFGEGQCGRQNTPFSFGADSTNKPRKEKQRKAQHPEHRDRIMRTLWQLNFSCGGGGGRGELWGQCFSDRGVRFCYGLCNLRRTRMVGAVEGLTRGFGV